MNPADTEDCGPLRIVGARDVEFAGALDAFESTTRLQIRMVAGFAEIIERKEILVAGAYNHPNCLVLPFRMELIRLVG